MKRLIECVPNFSDGRDPAKVDAIVAAMREVPGVFLLDRQSDADHNRSVITMVGEPESVAEAALRGVGKAAELIDLTRHTGEHPRLGATDVVPFIPLEGTTIEDCVVIARNVGREIWKRYRIPVYFYEAAAQRPERANLENIRSGQFEGLLEEVMRNPDRSPDVGDPRLHPTVGATVVGARKFLIAYNIHLNTPDVSIAKSIAKTIRFSSGGLRYVKAIGVDLKSRRLAQVSTNLTDFEQTPLHRVFELVKREAERYGVAITGSEIIGLVPRRAIELTAEFYLQLENFSAAQVLENRMESAFEGAASGAGRHATSFESVPAASTLPYENLGEAARREDALQQTLKSAARAAMEVARKAAELFEKLGQLDALAAPSMLRDIRAGRSMAAASVQGALETVAAHMGSVADPDFSRKMKADADLLKSRIMEQPAGVDKL
jgi:glutamate formiminotransferase / formiminotetrahydrofolate cyclodeaminase